MANKLGSFTLLKIKEEKTRSTDQQKRVTLEKWSPYWHYSSSLSYLSSSKNIIMPLYFTLIALVLTSERD